MFPIPFLSQTEYEQVEYFADDYELYSAMHGEPTVINVHRIWIQSLPNSCGGEYDTINFSPVENICIFSKTQAVQELIRLHTKYETDSNEHKEEEYDICLARKYGTHHSCPIIESKP
jgi:hypothetical protein